MNMRMLRSGIILSAVCIIGFIVAIYHYTGVKDEPFTKVSAGLERMVDKNEMQDVGGRGLKRYYGLNSADYDGVMMYISQNGMSAEELLLIKVKEQTQLVEIEKVINKRIKSRRKDFEGYAPMQEKLLKNAQVVVRGSYILLSVSENALDFVAEFKKNT